MQRERFSGVRARLLERIAGRDAESDVGSRWMFRLDLEYPVTWRGSLVRAVVVRKPTANDIEAAAPGFIASGAPNPDDPIDSALRLLALLTDLPIELINELDISDYEALRDCIETAFAATVQREGLKLRAT